MNKNKKENSRNFAWPFFRTLGWIAIIIMGILYVPLYPFFLVSRVLVGIYFWLAGNLIAPSFGAWIKINNKALSIKKGKPMIFVLNHLSFIDYFISTLVAGIFSKRYTVVFGSNLIRQWPIFGWVLPKWFISLDRDSETSRKECVKKIFKALDKGWNVLIFPEGTRMTADDIKNGKILNDFFDSVFRISIKKNIDIIPVCIHAREFCAKDEVSIRPSMVKVDILEPAVPSNFESYHDLMLDVRSRMMNVLSRDK